MAVCGCQRNSHACCSRSRISERRSSSPTGNSAPEDVLHPGLLISGHAEALAKDAVAKAKKNATPAPAAKAAEAQAISVIIHTADKRMRVLLNGKLAFEDSVTDQAAGASVRHPCFQSDRAVGRSRKNAMDGGRVEKQVDAAASLSKPCRRLRFSAAFTIHRVDIPDITAHRLTGLLHPGATMIITDQPGRSRAPHRPGLHDHGAGRHVALIGDPLIAGVSLRLLGAHSRHHQRRLRRDTNISRRLQGTPDVWIFRAGVEGDQPACNSDIAPDSRS